MLIFEIFSLDDNYPDWMITTQTIVVIIQDYPLTYGFIGIE